MVGKSRRYEPTREGLRLISGLMVLREHILEPLIRGVLAPEPKVPTSSATSLDRRYYIIREQMHEVLRELGLAA